MEEQEQGIEWPALMVHPSRLEPFVEYRNWWSPWRKEVALGTLSPEEAKLQLDAWGDWLGNLLGEESGTKASVGFKLGISLLRPDAPTPVIMMNAIAGLLGAIQQEVGYLRWKLEQATPPAGS